MSMGSRGRELFLRPSARKSPARCRPALEALEDRDVPAAFLNPGFEQPVVNGSLPNPTGSAWTFTGTSGIAANGSAFNNPNAPEGNQVAFLQQQGGISQTADLAAGTYSVRFWAAQRPGNSETFQVKVDGTVVGTFQPASASYQAYATDSFTVAEGSHTLEFLGTNTNNGDHTAFIDQVTLAENLGLPQPPAMPTLALFPIDDPGGHKVTPVTRPRLVGTTDANVTIELLDASGNKVALVDPNNPDGPPVFSVLTDPVTGAFTIQFANPLPDGQVTVRVRASNTFGSTFSPLLTFTVQSGGPDPADSPGAAVVGGTLVVTGTAGDDVVHLARQGGTLRVYANFLPDGVPFLTFHPDAVRDVRIVLGAGDDVATVAGDLRLPVVLNGGTGHDTLMGGTGDEVIRGGRGNDVLVGSGRDELRGGPGRDVVLGGLAGDWLEGVAGRRPAHRRRHGLQR